MKIKICLLMLVLGLCFAYFVQAQSETTTNWDYVVLGDQVMWGVAPFYAERLEADLGITITLHNHTHPAMRSESLLVHLRYDTILQEDIRNAEIITLSGLFKDLIPPIESVYVLNNDTCGGEDNRECFRTAISEYRENFEAIVNEILSLVGEREVVLRVMSIYYPVVTHPEGLRGHFRGKMPQLQEVRPYLEALNQHTLDVAEKYEIPALDVYHALNGPNGEIDPRDQGYIYWDELHLTEKGSKLIAELLRALGYQPLSPMH